jgi:hypothetical protein
MWGLALFWLGQLALNAALECWTPDVRDPEHTAKRDCLRATLAESPGHPLVLFLGSSRTLFGLQPDLMGSSGPSAARAPLVYNFGITEFGFPLYELVCLRRLLADGIHPDWVFLEVLPACLPERHSQERPSFIRRLSGGDLGLVGRYWKRAGGLYEQWGLMRLVPCFSYRFALMSSLAPSWIPFSSRQDYFAHDIDRRGWLHSLPSVSSSQRRRFLEKARAEYFEVLQHFSIPADTDRALRETLDLCRAQGIRAALYIMPEGPAFQSWYSPATRTLVDAYLSTLCRQYRIPLVDARNWVGDDDFYDAHHLMRSGARVFSKHMGQVALQQIVEHP